MKKSTLTLATVATAVLFTISSAFANSTSVANTPNYENWDYGNDPLKEVMEMEQIPTIQTASTTVEWDYTTDPLNEVLEMGEMPAINNPVYINKLELDAVPSKDNFLVVDLPYGDNEVVGLVIYDKKGNIVFNQKDEYRALKTVLIADTGDNEYILKAYRGNSIYEARLKVVHI